MSNSSSVGRISIVAAALLFVSSLWTPDPQNTLTVCSGYHSGTLEGWRSRESGSTSGPAANPPGGWGHSHTGVSPPKGGIWPVGHGGLVRRLIPHLPHGPHVQGAGTR